MSDSAPAPLVPIDASLNYADITGAIACVQSLCADGITAANFHAILAAAMMFAAKLPTTSAGKKAFVQEVISVLLTKYCSDPLVAQLLRQLAPDAIDVMCSAAHGVYEFSSKKAALCATKCGGCDIM